VLDTQSTHAPCAIGISSSSSLHHSFTLSLSLIRSQTLMQSYRISLFLHMSDIDQMVEFVAAPSPHLWLKLAVGNYPSTSSLFWCWSSSCTSTTHHCRCIFAALLRFVILLLLQITSNLMQLYSSGWCCCKTSIVIDVVVKLWWRPLELTYYIVHSLHQLRLHGISCWGPHPRQ
jgi:hypothetical protein